MGGMLMVTDKERERMELRYRALVEADLRGEDVGWGDGWNDPPAQIPRAGEIGAGVYYDPRWNTYGKDCTFRGAL